MWKKLIVCAGMLAPLAIFGGCQTAEEPEDAPAAAEKNICVDIGFDQGKCVQAPQCFWDTSDQRCEWIQDPSRCAKNPDPGSCNLHGHCFWDTSDQRCERI
jgi:hypothetical protein